MGLISQDPYIRRRQFGARKQIGVGIILLTLGVSCIFALFQYLQPTCENCHKLNRSRRQAESEGAPTATSAPRIADAFDYSIFSYQLKQAAGVDDAVFATFQENFYNHFFKQYFKLDKMENEQGKADYLASGQTDDAAAARACDDSLKQLYNDRYQVNEIYWCDSEEGMPTDMFNIEERQQGWIVLYFIGMIYMFVALAIVCDEYFVPALEVITDKLALSPDVAGATFMAAGGSAPELFTSIIGVFIADSNVGIGTIVGSAVFNILFVLGMCAFVVGMQIDPATNKPTVLNLTWFPLTRDTVFYVVSLVALVVSFSAGPVPESVEWWESLIMFMIYIAYVTFMMFNAKIEEKCVGSKEPEAEEGETTEMIEKKKTGAALWSNAVKKVDTKATHFHTQQVAKLTATFQSVKADRDGELASYAVARFYALRKRIPNDKGINLKPKEDPEDSEESEIDGFGEDDSPWAIKLPSGEESLLKNIMLICLYPLTIPLKFTVPDVRYPRVKRTCGGNIYILSFFMSIVWIIIYSYLMVWWATRIGETYNIDSALMGLTFLAAGTSVPDLITSVLVAKEGHGDMAVSSSIGSNIFDVTVGLPLPWLLYSAVFQKPKSVSSGGLVCSIGLLLLMLVTLIASIVATGWKMNRVMGFMMLALYAGFVAVSLLLEYGVIECPF